MRPIEFNSVINRTQMQERDDSRPVVEQQTMSHMENKEVMVKSSQINPPDCGFYQCHMPLTDIHLHHKPKHTKVG